MGPERTQLWPATDSGWGERWGGARRQALSRSIPSDNNNRRRGTSSTPPKPLVRVPFSRESDGFRGGWRTARMPARDERGGGGVHTPRPSQNNKKELPGARAPIRRLCILKKVYAQRDRRIMRESAPPRVVSNAPPAPWWLKIQFVPAPQKNKQQQQQQQHNLGDTLPSFLRRRNCCLSL